MRAKFEQQASPEKRDEALERADELERNVLSERPDPGRIRNVLRWFRDHAPELAGAIVSVVVNPLVGKVVEGAGETIADQFREIVRKQGVEIATA